MEKWKKIPGFERYKVSDSGKVFSTIQNKCLKFGKHKGGYQYVFLSKNMIPHHRYVHRLVKLAFHGEPPKETPMVLHMDDDPTNNNLWNLKYGTNKENIDSAVASGRKIPPWLGKFGADHHSSKKVNQYDLDGNFIQTFNGIKDAERACNVFLGRALKSGGRAGKYLWRYAPFSGNVKKRLHGNSASIR